MCTHKGPVEQPACPWCGSKGLLHDASCPSRRFFAPLPGAPGPPFSVSLRTVLDAIARVLNGRSVGDADEEFVALARAVIAQASFAGPTIEIRDSSIVLLNARDINGLSSISVNVSGLQRDGFERAGEALKQITEAVTGCLEITAAQRSDLLELLDELSKQALLSRSEQAKPGVIKGILAALATGLGAAGGVAEVWSTWGPSIESFFGL